MSWLPHLGHGATKALFVVSTSALVVVGLLNGACSSTPPSGHCWHPGVCYEVSDASSCGGGESFSEGECPDTLRVGACIGADERRIYLYAPLHGLFQPDCSQFAGPGAHYEAE